MPFESPESAETPLALGPLLFFRASDAATWRLRVLVLARQSPPRLSARGVGVPWEAVWSWGERVAYAADIVLPRGTTSCYQIGEQSWSVSVPARGAALHIACTACNGEEDEEPAVWRGDRDRIWRHLADTHAASPVHLLLQLGDQVYADPVWDCDPRLAGWRRSGRSQRAKAPFPADLRERVRGFYLQRYLDTLRGAAQSRLFAEVPQISIWDDHDIFDGWGSWRDSDQDSPVFQGLFAAARETFQVLQRGVAPGAWPPKNGPEADAVLGPAPPLGLRLWIDDCLFVVPDLRSERRRDRMLGGAGWSFLDESLDAAQSARRVLLISSVPFLNANLSPLERLLVLIPGQQLYQDDLRDQWTSYEHRTEWRRLERRLSALVAQGREVTILSGEIHLGALGLAETGGGSYVQAIAPGIAHRPPPRNYVRFLERIARLPSSPGSPGGLVPLPNQGGRRYLARRGWVEVSLPPDGPARLAWRGPEVDALGIALQHPGAARPETAAAAGR